LGWCDLEGVMAHLSQGFCDAMSHRIAPYRKSCATADRLSPRFQSLDPFPLHVCISRHSQICLGRPLPKLADARVGRDHRVHVLVPLLFYLPDIDAVNRVVIGIQPNLSPRGINVHPCQGSEKRLLGFYVSFNSLQSTLARRLSWEAACTSPHMLRQSACLPEPPEPRSSEERRQSQQLCLLWPEGGLPQRGIPCR